MNDYARELLEGYQPGDRVQVTYGTRENQQNTTGTIVKITDNFLQLGDPAAKISVEDLRAIAKKTDPQQTPQPAPIDIQRRMAGIPPEETYQFSFGDARIKALRNEIKSSCSKEIRNAANRVLDLIQGAIKNNALKDKYPEAKKLTMDMWSQCESVADYRYFYLLLGTINVVAEKYDDALEPLVRAKEYQMAAYAAAKGGRTEWQERLYMCAVLARKDSSSLNRYVLEICFKNKDIEPLCFLLKENSSDSEVCELIASCLAEIYKAAKTAEFQGVNITVFDGAAEAAKKIVNAFPPSWKSGSGIMACWEEYEGYTYPKGQEEPEDTKHYGTVISFRPDHKVGYIESSGKSYGFHVCQIVDDEEGGILLRRLLSCGQARGLEVSFYLGADRWGYCAATDIVLTKKGLDEANRRLQPSDSLHGEIKNFFPEKGYMGQGYIKVDGHPDYSFYAQAVIDPYLKAFMKANDPAGQFVGFSVGYDTHGRKYAYDLFWEDPRPADWEQYAAGIPAKELDAWKNRDVQQETEADDTGDYSEYKFDPLALWQPASPPKPNPLTWPAISPKTIPAPDPGPVHEQDQATVPQPSVEKAMELASRGRIEILNGHLREAERLLTQALELGAPPDSVVGDLITIYLRMPEKLESQAVPLLEKYEKDIQENKLLNLRISVYDKLKDHPKLASLFEEAYQKADTVSKRSHNLLRLIDAYLSCGNHNKALETCKRWDTLYQQNRYSSDASKLKKAEPNINRKKAICLYHMGDVEQARHIAIDLLRLNPADQAANAILDGTLTENIAQFATPEDEVPYDQDALATGEDDGAEPSSIPGFVSAQIMDIDLGSILKGSVKDGKYSGDVKKAERDIKQLAKSDDELRRGNTAKTRSDRLFAACKIIEDVEARADTTWSKDLEKEERLAGRAMALWGDYMAGWSAQMDTPRMAYLYALRLLPGKAVEQHWANAYTRYIKSYFISKKDLETYIDEQTSSSHEDGPNTDILVQGKLPDVLFAEFFVGVLKLLDALSDQKNKRSQFIRELYGRNRKLRETVCRHMRLFLDDNTVPVNPDQGDFRRYLDRSCERLHERMDDLRQELEGICQTFLEAELSASVLEQLDKDKWARDLIATDGTRMGEIYKLLQRSQDYFTNTDFENRAECLRTVLEGVNTLQRSIQSEPTELSYDVYLPVLQEFAAKLTERQDRLYVDFKPRLTWDERPVASRTKEGTVMVTLKVRNESSHQAADQLRVADSHLGAAVKWLKNSSVIASLRGGEEREFILDLDVIGSALDVGSFSLGLCYSFKFSDTPQTVITTKEETLLSIVIPSSDPIEYPNPYKKYIGQEMTDKSMFYGRDNMIQQLVQMVYSDEDDQMIPGHATAIYGQTRCGKSSIFYHFQTRLREKYGDRVVIWNLGNIGDMFAADEKGDLFSKFLYKMLIYGGDALYTNATLSARIDEAGLESPDEELLFHPEVADSLFNKYMIKLNKILAEENCIIVLLLDEFTYLYGQILEGRLSPHFMKFWKSLLENYRIFAFVIGQDNMKEFMNQFQNEFARMETIEISYLDEASAKLLIREPLEHACKRRQIFDAAALDMLYRLTAGCTYLTLILCANLVDYLNDRQPFRVTTGIVEDFLYNRLFSVMDPKLSMSESNFEPQLHERGHAEFDATYKEILTSVALNSQTNGWASIDAIHRDVNAENTDFLLQRLVDRHILLKTNNQYKILVGLLAQWLIHTEGGK